MLAWAIRLGGLLHPQAYTSDLGLHANNLRGVTGGEIIFTETLPGEAGGGPAPYPPAQYVMLLPFRLLLGAERLIEAGNTLADSLFIVSGWLLLRTAGASARIALFAGSLYLFATPLLVSLSIGEMANVWGQALVGPLLLVLYGWHAGVLPTWALVATLAIAFLGHLGVFLSLLPFFAVYLALLFIRDGPWARLAGVLALALLVVVAVFYSSFARSVAADGGNARVPFGLGRVRHELVLSLGLMGRTGPLNAGLGLAGLALLFRRVAEGRAMELLWLLLLAWWLSALLSLGTLLWTQQALRWQAFLFPALALCGGVVLAALHHRGGARRALAYALLTIIIVRGAALWYVQIATYQH